MGTATPVTTTDAQATPKLPVPVKAVPDPTLPAPVTVIPVQPPMAESQLGGSYINDPQVHDSSNISVCSSDLDTQENLKSHFNNRLSDKIYNAFRVLFSIVNINSVWEILPKITKYNTEIAKFVEDINVKYGIVLNCTKLEISGIKHWNGIARNYTKLEISEIKHWTETYQVVANSYSQPEWQQPQVPQISVTVSHPLHHYSESKRRK